ncbi:MAG TPA: 2-hydroxyacid dehydrogenase [Candidatus Omnitrophota bacterium]|nr:2-hydroxyacid dehydrogenase [Candidatus Omnitrophota bacterium]HQL41178.1 2-hydroxyacid dehydrogenase [Candidatus Omnitrophota bacterium]
MKKIAFFDTKPYDQKFFDEVNQRHGFHITYYPSRLDENTAVFAQGADVVCAFVNDVISAGVIEKLKSSGVKLIALRCAGYNNVDLKAAYGSIPVVRVPAYSPHAVAEHAIALMMALNRKTHRAYDRVRDGNFSINGLLGFDMYEKKAGVIGLGKIGKCLVSILKGFGMEVMVYDKIRDEAFAKENNIRYVDLDTLYAQSDIISLNCPLTPETNHMINAGSIAKMRKGVMIINTGRGKLIDTKALIDGLKAGQVGSAGLDVYEEESEYFFEDFSAAVISDDVLARLLTFPNVIVTSHQAFFTHEALINIATTTLKNVEEFFKDGYLENEICYRCEKECRKAKKMRCF